VANDATRDAHARLVFGDRRKRVHRNPSPNTPLRGSHCPWDWMSISPPRPPFVAGNDAPLVAERAATRGRSATGGGDEHAAVKGAFIRRAQASRTGSASRSSIGDEVECLRVPAVIWVFRDPQERFAKAAPRIGHDSHMPDVGFLGLQEHGAIGSDSLNRAANVATGDAHAGR
jgi:hypothetical protein